MHHILFKLVIFLFKIGLLSNAQKLQRTTCLPQCTTIIINIILYIFKFKHFKIKKTEAGGFDGEDLSNSLFFELNRGWKGLLIEPIPEVYSMIIGKNRKTFSINACIAESKPKVVKFQIGASLSGRDGAMNEQHKKRLKNENPINRVIDVPCFSLNTVMKALGVKKIDMFSLDVGEGGEYDFLKTIDFNKLDIETFLIKHNDFPKELKRVRELFEHEIKLNDPRRKYSEIKKNGQDIFFLKSWKGYFF